jgi:hypothetical protein
MSPRRALFVHAVLRKAWLASHPRSQVTTQYILRLKLHTQIHCRHSTCFGKARAALTRARHSIACSESKQVVMTFGDLLRRFLCCSKRTDIKGTHELPSRPKQSSPVLSIPSHDPQHHSEPSPPLLKYTDGLDEHDSESSMAPKRKATSTAASSDSAVKKAKPTKKAAKAAPGDKEGEPAFLSFHS